ncbi:MAG: photosystem II assembly protein Psb35 [Microcystis aeruginosa]
MYLLLEVASGKFPFYFVAVYVVGFLAAITIGSIAWYNSKRPVGWEDAQRPDIIPEVKTEVDSDSQS